MYSHRPSLAEAQDANASSSINSLTAEKFREPIAGLAERDAFIVAILACDGLRELELKMAIRLALHFNCTTGQCNPGYPRLAAELKITPRSARRTVTALIAHGIVGGDPSAGGNHDEKRKFSLYMPPARVTPTKTPVSHKPHVTLSSLTTMTGDSNRGVTGDSNRGGRVTLQSPHNTDKNTHSNTERVEDDARSEYEDTDVTETEIFDPETLPELKQDRTIETGPTHTEIAPGAKAPAIEELEDQSNIDRTPAELLPITSLPDVTRDGAALDRPAKVARYYIVGRPEAGDVGRMARRPGLDEAAADAHVTSNDDNSEEQAMYVDADGHFPRAGRKPVREVGPDQIAVRRKFFDKTLARYPNQPAHEADDVDALIALMLTDRKSITPFVDMLNALYREMDTGRRDVPTLKNCMLRNWRAMHNGVAAPLLARGVQR